MLSKTDKWSRSKFAANMITIEKLTETFELPTGEQRLIDFLVSDKNIFNESRRYMRIHDGFLRLSISNCETQKKLRQINSADLFHFHDKLLIIESQVPDKMVCEFLNWLAGDKTKWGQALSFNLRRENAASKSIAAGFTRNTLGEISLSGARILVEQYILIDDQSGWLKSSMDHAYSTKPRLSLISSLFSGKQYIPSYIGNIIASTIFDQSELLIMDASGEYADLEKLTPYLLKHKNIRYFKLKKDPGLYDIWNLGIELSRSKYVSNANLDDRRHPLQMQACVELLDRNPDVDLVSTHVVPIDDFAGDYTTFLSNAPHVYFSCMQGKYEINDMFVLKDNSEISSQCIPHCAPVWRKKIHNYVGYFDERQFSSAADFDLWLKALRNGLNFHLLPIPATYYYINPKSYMRVDNRHQQSVDALYEMYMKDNVYSVSPYSPDFEKLSGLITLSINS